MRPLTAVAWRSVAGVLLLGGARAPGWLSAQTPVAPVNTFANVRAVIGRLMADRPIASVVVAAAKDGRIVWEQGFGWANREHHIQATPTVMYSLASISKPITATGLMILVQRGQVDLDRPADDYLGPIKLRAYEGQTTEATVRRIANHTSGLPVHWHFYYDDEAERPPPFDTTMAHYAILVAPPGTRAQYSNLGFGILDAIIARTSGTPYPEFMRREVFVPLGLSRTAVVTRPLGGDTIAERYDGRGQRLPWYDFDHRGASGVYASAHDLLRFGMFHLKDHLPDQRAILPDSTLDTMHQPTASHADKIGYGVGWRTNYEDHGYTAIGHTGGMPGVSTMLRLFPEANVAIVVLTNSGDNDATGRIARALTAALLPRYAEQLRAAPDTAPPDTSTAARWSAPPGPLQGDWDGAVRMWSGTVPVHLSVRRDSTVRITFGTASAVPLTRLEWRNQVLSGQCAGTIPTPDGTARPHLLLVAIRLHGDTLSGAVASQASDPIRLTYALSSYVRLTRKGP